MLAMTYMYNGQQEFGLDLLQRCLHNISCRWGYTWDAPNTVRGDADTGQRAFGADYYQNMMLWAAPGSASERGPDRPNAGGRVGGAGDRGRKRDLIFCFQSVVGA